MPVAGRQRVRGKRKNRYTGEVQKLTGPFRVIAYAGAVAAAFGFAVNAISGILVFCLILTVISVRKLHTTLSQIPYDKRWEVAWDPIRLAACMLIAAGLLGLAHLPALDTTAVMARIDFLERAICGAIAGGVFDASHLRRK